MSDASLSCSAHLACHLENRDAEILDFGCGSGRAGAALASLGFRHIDGLDPSAGMLRQARATGVYRTLVEARLLGPIDLPDRSYDAIVAPEIFVTGGAGPGILGELVRLLRAGGLVSLAVPESGGFREVFDRLAGTGELLQLGGTWDRLSAERDPGGRFLVLGRF